MQLQNDIVKMYSSHRRSPSLLQIVPAVTELIVAELLFLNFDSPEKPVYFYINSTGSQVRSSSSPRAARVFVASFRSQQECPRFPVAGA